MNNAASRSLIFVGGINRSGTTLLQSVLCADSAACPLLHEASYLRSIVDACEFGNLKLGERVDGLYEDRSVVVALDKFYESVARD